MTYHKLEELKKVLEKERQNKIIVFTNGCYDILHAGHINTLKRASEIGKKRAEELEKSGSIFIVALNSDNSVKKFKGENRPINNEKDRAYVISNIKGVDYVTIFQEDNPLNLLREIKPDIMIKGGAAIPERVKEEKEIVERYGGELIVLDLIEGYSTTKLIEEMKS